MKPVALLQHESTQRPGVLRDYLSQQGIPYVTYCPALDGSVPMSARDYSGVVFLGSQHSVNDSLPWIQKEVELVRNAMAANVPVLGHCFGAQLMAKALGATVSRNAYANIGWSRVRVTPYGRTLFNAPDIVAFNWHYETFGIPDGAKRVLFGEHCINKGFTIDKHMAFQCHFEVSEEIIRDWCSEAADELSAARGPAVQSRAKILGSMRSQLPALHLVAKSIYARWAAGLVRPPMVASYGGW